MTALLDVGSRTSRATGILPFQLTSSSTGGASAEPWNDRSGAG